MESEAEYDAPYMAVNIPQTKKTYVNVNETSDKTKVKVCNTLVTFNVNIHFLSIFYKYHETSLKQHSYCTPLTIKSLLLLLIGFSDVPMM